MYLTRTQIHLIIIIILLIDYKLISFESLFTFFIQFHLNSQNKDIDNKPKKSIASKTMRYEIYVALS